MDPTKGKIDPAQKRFVVIEANKKKIIRGIFIFWLTSTVFLFLRIILTALGSDPKALFAAFIYLVSGIFLLPFFGIFPDFNDTIQAGKSTFDAPALTAMFCYTILVLLAMAITWIVANILKTNKQVEETVSKDHPVDPTEAEKIVR